MGPRVPELHAARAVVLIGIALVGWVGARAPAAPEGLGLVRAGASCRLETGGASGAPACACSDMPGEVRAALGLPAPLNAAGEAELERVPGLGPVRARAIAAERARGGDFASLDALAERVPGIGPGTVDRIRSHLFAVGPDPACGEGRFEFRRRGLAPG